MARSAGGLASGLAFVLATAWAYDLFVPEAQPVGWLAQPTLSNFDVSGGGETIYSVTFDPAAWSGNLHAYPISGDGLVDRQTDRFSGGAAAQLDMQNFDTGREIFTMGLDGRTKPFRWASLDATQRAAIGNNTDGPKILNYVRGARSNEAPSGAKLRVSDTVLGDILHSRPLYSPGDGNPLVYVGANDGMLHAFDADTGREQWAYVPSMLIPKLRQLAPPAEFAYAHAHFVDASPTLGTATKSGVDYSILAGGLGAGGQGLYALDVTNDATAPLSSESAENRRIRFEVTPTSINNQSSTVYRNLGFTYAAPLVTRTNSDRSVVIASNGYQSATGAASLYVIDALSGALVREIVAGTPSVASPNGLSGFASVDIDFNGTIDYAFAGDLDGTLWKFDLRDSVPSNWTATAVFQTSPAQPIMAPPAVALHPEGGFMLNFATGALFSEADRRDATTVYYAYGIRELAPGSGILEHTLTDALYGTGDLAQRVRTITATQPHATFDRGWRVPLPAGERVVGDSSFIKNGRYYFVTTNPAVNIDSPPAGDNWLYELDYLTGGSANLTPFLDLNGDNALNDADRLVDVEGNPILTPDGVPVGKGFGRGVLSQPILIQLGSLNTTKFSQNDNTVFFVDDIPAGVSGGHFDFDIYHALGDVDNRKHKHEYDDTYGVTGVNMLNASEPAFNLANVDSLFQDSVVTGDCVTVASLGMFKRRKDKNKDKDDDGSGGTNCTVEVATTEFKVLAINQYLNPAVMLRVGPDAVYEGVRTWRNQTVAQTAAAVLAPEVTPVYTASTIGNFVFNLPQDAFSSRDWWGDGIPRAGLIPTQTGCVNDQDSDGNDDDPGLNGERHNGAFTLQLIRADTPPEALVLNYPAGGPAYGWMVRQGADYERYVHAEYTAFWHHKNKACYGDSGWTPTPTQDFSVATNAAHPPAGTGDPRGSFADDIDNPPVKVKSKTVNNVTTLEVTYQDGSVITTTITETGGGGARVEISDGTDSETVDLMGGRVLDGIDESRTTTLGGRLNWREL
jgi:hypothetical protein